MDEQVPGPNDPLVARLLPTTPGETPQQTWTGVPVPEGYLGMIEEVRELLDRVAVAAPSAEVVADTTKALAEINASLGGHEVEEGRRLSGQLLGVPGRAALTAPALYVDRVDEDVVTGRVRFGQHFMGSNGVVHGGAIPLLFDDLLGRLAVAGGRSRSRTAFLHVDYRSVAPVDTELQVEARFDREEGRKRYLRGTLREGERLCAEATGLFVALLPGQR